MSLDTIHIDNQYPQQGDTLLSKIVNLPQQINVSVDATELPDSIGASTFMSAKDSTFVDSIYRALNDSIHHLDSIVNHISTYGTDMPTEIKSFVIPFVIGILAFVIPLICNMRLKLQERYRINKIDFLLREGGVMCMFNIAAFANAILLVIYCIYSAQHKLPRDSEGIYQITIIAVISLYILILYTVLIIWKIRRLFNYNRVYKKALKFFNARVIERGYKSSKGVEYCKWIRSSLIDCIDYKDSDTMQELVEIIREKNIWFLYNRRNNYKTTPLVYAPTYYAVIEDIIKYSLQKDLDFTIEKITNSIPQNFMFAHHDITRISQETLLCYFTLLQIAREQKRLSFIDDFYEQIEKDANKFPQKLPTRKTMRGDNIIDLKRFAYLNGALLFAEGNKTVTGYNTNIIQVDNKQHIFPLNKEEIFLYFAYAFSHANGWSFRKEYGIRMKSNDFAGLANKLVRYTAFQLCEDELNQFNHPIDNYGTFDFSPYVGTGLVKDISNDKELYSKMFTAIIQPMITIAPQIGLYPTKFPLPPQQLISDALNALIAAGIIN